jgi:hypothetical protein
MPTIFMKIPQVIVVEWDASIEVDDETAKKIEEGDINIADYIRDNHGEVDYGKWDDANLADGYDGHTREVGETIYDDITHFVQEEEPNT